MLHQLVSAQFMVKAAWELVWLYIKTTKQITFVRHMVSPLCDASTPPTRHTAPQQWGMRPRKRDYAGWTGVQTLTAVHQLSVWETLLGYWTGFFFSKMGKYPSFKDCCKSKKKKNGCTASLLYSKVLGVPYCCIILTPRHLFHHFLC